VRNAENRNAETPKTGPPQYEVWVRGFNGWRLFGRSAERTGGTLAMIARRRRDVVQVEVRNAETADRLTAKS